MVFFISRHIPFTKQVQRQLITILLSFTKGMSANSRQHFVNKKYNKWNFPIRRQQRRHNNHTRGFMMEGQQHGDQLKRGLKNRHIQLTRWAALSGLACFWAARQSLILQARIILGYAIAGFIAFLIMRQLGEMVVEEPVAGSFSHFAYKYWGNFAGFASGWNYWVLYVLVAMAELTAVGNISSSGGQNLGLRSAAFFVIINDDGFWFAIIKVVASGDDPVRRLATVQRSAGPQAGQYATCGSKAVSCHTVSQAGNDDGYHHVLLGGLELVGITTQKRTTRSRAFKSDQPGYLRILIFYGLTGCPAFSAAVDARHRGYQPVRTDFP
jgi:aromatic amino acid transport protein AroP